MFGIQLKPGEAQHLRYVRDTERPEHEPRFVKGIAYVPPKPSNRQKIGTTTIETGKRYEVTPRRPLLNPHGVSSIASCVMIAALNRRGEMMLCHTREDGTAYGGYHLDTFLQAILFVE